MKKLKEICKRLVWEVQRFTSWLAFRVLVDPFTFLTDLPDGYTPYEKGYEAYESEKKRYEKHVVNTTRGAKGSKGEEIDPQLLRAISFAERNAVTKEITAAIIPAIKQNI